MKVAFLIIAFQADHLLEQCIRSVAPFGPIVAAEGPVRFWQQRGYTVSTDRTNDILDQYHVKTVHGQWSEKDEEQNAALSLVDADTDFIWCVDADEIWKQADIIRIISILKADYTDSMSFKATSFFGGFDRYMTGFEENFEVHRIQRYYPGARFTTHRPPTICAPDGVPWRKKRHLDHNVTDGMALRFYHYSYVFPTQMAMKSEYYASMGGTIPDYFVNVYLPWVQGDSEEKFEIEGIYKGVHNWLPSRRGECKTAPFLGYHPREVELSLHTLRKRLRDELREL